MNRIEHNKVPRPIDELIYSFLLSIELFPERLDANLSQVMILNRQR